MLSTNAVNEFRNQWLPSVSNDGLTHLLRMLDHDSPLLLRGNWINDFPNGADVADFAAGCLATQIGWHHPLTADEHGMAGYRWLVEVANVDPATSSLLRAWDGGERVEAELAYLVREEIQRRQWRADGDRTLVRLEECRALASA